MEKIRDMEFKAGYVEYYSTSSELWESLPLLLAAMSPDKVFLITDDNVRRCVLSEAEGLDGIPVFSVPPGEGSKSLETASRLWSWLGESGATRRSVVLNVGGGVVTDLGGFVAATFKRGVRFLNIPTTLLAVADAAIGGKTGIDFAGLKNEVGVFAPAEKVLISPELLRTVPEAELRSGFAEVVKMAMLTNKEIYEELLRPDALHDTDILGRAMRLAADEKLRIVREDPTEKGLRKLLNLGHTAGHAYESYAASIGKPISHGEAVAHGLLRALELSRDRCGFPAERVGEYDESILKRYYSPLSFGHEADVALETLMAHDKKNLVSGFPNWVLLHDIGDPLLP